VAASAAGQKGVSINQILDKPMGVLGQVLSNYYGVAYTGMNHTSEYTTITSTGPGSLPFEGLVRNTDVFPRLTNYMGIQFKNPSMTPAQGAKFNKG
jgi:alkaline phosphatase